MPNSRCWPSALLMLVLLSLAQVLLIQGMVINAANEKRQVPTLLQQPSSAQAPEFVQPPFSYRWLSVRPFQEYSTPLHPENDISLLLQYLEKRGNEVDPNDEAQRDIRSPLGTMRFGKRAAGEDLNKRNPLGTMRFGKRSNPLGGTMRFGKRGNPLGTMRFGKREMNED